MEEPRADLKADLAERAEAPDFDELVDPEEMVRGERTRDDFFDAVLGLDSPATAKEVADLAGHGVDAAREYLEWFEQLGIVTKYDGRPATYERNDAYFEWRRINQLAADHSVSGLQGRVRELTTRINEYEEAYDAVSPAAVDAVAVAEASDELTIDDVYSDLADWQTVREERERYERARQQRTGSECEHASG